MNGSNFHIKFNKDKCQLLDSCRKFETAWKEFAIQMFGKAKMKNQS